MIRILSISGSLRAQSSNTSLLQAARHLAPPDMTITPYDGLADLPHFNPDLEAVLPLPVRNLRERVGDADALLICCPEYARGIPGSFKNALDWLVGCTRFPGKPVALFNASARASAAQAALRLVLETMSAHIVDDACITVDLLAKGLSPKAIAADLAIAVPVRVALATLAAEVRRATGD
ncbi:NADPH-dependent FMN reductase [Methylovirgula sp. 4M-Z18]|uniref:NADPH-dependent FMN reductase n=1 Tax=Methylovirgula sp. 4M-Z18 TaxID=2293567 RepID=UPI000E2EA600|nr:NADPH-dependent FMN reductase [Methylovirgula sp. 4M-Z18]RFB78737.1 NAD(P)H-dependent oxidoreductase [Methylovirgula sp. 4M-Z18]